MLPTHLASVLDAYFWIPRWFDQLGGAYTPDPLRLELLVGDGPLDEEAIGQESGLELEPARVLLGDFTLTVQFVFNEQLDADTYRFDYRKDGDLRWRHDKHPGHEKEDGTDRHFHVLRHGKEAREPVLDEPTFDEIARLIAATT